MGLVNQTIPGLYGGVSQQAPELRHDTQVTEMINCMPTVIGGVQKRKGTEVLFSDPTIPSDAFIYTYDRGTGDEQYMIFINSNSEYRIFDLVTKTWVTPDWNSESYLAIPSLKAAKNCFSLSTVGDTTFVVNKTVVPEVSTSLDFNDDPNWQGNFYYWLKRTNGDAGDNASLRYTYYIRSDDPLYKGTATASNTTGDLTDSTKTFPVTLTGLTLHNLTKGWSAVITGSTATTITTGANSESWNNGDEYEIVVQTTTHDSNLGARELAKLINGVGDPHYTATASGSVLKVAHTNGYKLSGSDSWGNQASEGFQGKIKKLQDLPNEFGFEGAVVEVSGDDDTGFDNYYVKYEDGVWKETFKPGLANSVDATTMPHKITVRRNTDSTYNTAFSVIDYNTRSVGDDSSASIPSFIDYGMPIQDVFFYRNRLGFLAGDNVVLSESGEYYNFFPTTVTSVIDSDPIDVAVDSNQAINLKYATPFNKELLIFGNKAQFVMSASDTLTPSNVSVQQSTAFDIKEVAPVVLGPNAYFAIEKTSNTSIREYYVQPDSLSNDAADVTAHCPAYIPFGVTKLAGSSKNDMLFALSSETPDTLYVYNFYWNGEEKAQSAWHKWTFSGVIKNIEVIDGDLIMVIERGATVNIEKIPLQVAVKLSEKHLDGKTEAIPDGSITYQSEVTLTPVGFPTGSSKIDDRRNDFILRNILINADFGSFYSMEVLKYNVPKKYEYDVLGGVYPSLDLLPSQTLIPQASSYSMSTDGKYPVNGKAKHLVIKILNDLEAGFKINSLDFLGTLVNKSRGM